MNQWVLSHEPELRLGCFLAIFGIMAVWEIAAPRRQLTSSKPIRWANNLGMVVLNTLLLRVLFPTAAVGAAMFATDYGWGWGNLFVMPAWLIVLVSLLVLDLFIYLQHWLVHAVPLFWRFHRMHHADLDIDVTTGARFHPVEILFSMAIKFGVIFLLGPPVVAVVMFEIVLNATSMFSHANVQLPLSIDRWLRWLLVTPDMHRVHHSVERDETDRNFGFNLPWWDHLFGTYQAQPRAGHVGMSIGIPQFRSPRETSWLPAMLWLPFKSLRSEQEN